MKCPHCGNEHPENAQFCPITGEKLEQKPACVSCAREIKAGTRYCPYCGAAQFAGQEAEASLVFDQQAFTESEPKFNRSGRYFIIGLVVLLGMAALFWFWIRPNFLLNKLSITITPTPWIIPINTPTLRNFNPIGEPTLEAGQPSAGTDGAEETIPTTAPISQEGVDQPENSGVQAFQDPILAQPTATPGLETVEALPKLAPSTDWIIYAFDMNTSREIYTQNAVTGERRQVTRNSFRDEAPSPNADGSMIVYASYRNPDKWELYTLDVAGNTEKQITNFEGTARWPAWSPLPGDSRILFEGRESRSGKPDYAQNIWIVNADGSGLERLTDSGTDEDPEWSPDGKSIIFARSLADTDRNGQLDLNDNKDIFRLDLDSMTLTNLTNSPDNNDFDVSWSMDGQWIVFCSVREDADGNRFKNLDDSRDLFLMRPDGSQESRIELGNLRTFDPNWSPDGRQILFGVDLGENIEELWLFTLDGGGYTSITPRGPYFHPEWYP